MIRLLKFVVVMKVTVRTACDAVSAQVGRRTVPAATQPAMMSP